MRTALKTALAVVAGQAVDGLPKLEDFPEYVAERDKLQRIAADFNAATGLLHEIDERRKAMTKILAKAVDDRARAIVEDKQTPVRTVLESDRAQIELDVASLRAALTMQADRLDAVKIICVEQIIEQVKPKHQRMMAEIREKLLAVSDALDADHAFRVALYNEGVSFSAWPVIPGNLVRAIGSRAAFSSGVNVADRVISEYLGRAWDYSLVTR
jgi:hypothetical protein